MAYTEEQILEIQTTQKLIKQFEGIMRTTNNPESLKRNGIELKKLKDKLSILCPDGVPENLGSSTTKDLSASDDEVSIEVMKQFPIKKPSPNSEDEDVNLMATFLTSWEEEFMPALSESHLKLDFSSGQERDSFYNGIENLKRQGKILFETIEDYFKATREDVKGQLRDMRSRYMRAFLQEGAQYLKKMEIYWGGLLKDFQDGGSRVMNKEDKVIFDRKFESATYFSGKPVGEALELSVKYLREVIHSLNLPNL